MLPRKNRLIKRADFSNVYRIGKYFSEDQMLIKVCKNNLENTRIGFSIEKRVWKKATERNRMKRLLREAFYQNLENIKKGLDIVVFYKKHEEKPDFKIICELTKNITKKLNTK